MITTDAKSLFYVVVRTEPYASVFGAKLDDLFAVNTENLSQISYFWLKFSVIPRDISYRDMIESGFSQVIPSTNMMISLGITFIISG